MVKKGEVDLVEGIYEVNQGVRYWADLDQGFNNLLNEYGNQLVTIQRRNDGDDVWAYYYIIPGYQYWWRQTDGDSDHYELRDGEFFDDDTPKGWGDVGFIGMPNSITVIDGFGYNMGSNGANGVITILWL